MDFDQLKLKASECFFKKGDWLEARAVRQLVLRKFFRQTAYEVVMDH